MKSLICLIAVLVFGINSHALWDFSAQIKPGYSATDPEEFHGGRLNDWDLFNFQAFFQAISMKDNGIGFGGEFGWSHILWFETPPFGFYNSTVEVYEETFNVSGIIHYSPSIFYLQGGPQLHLWDDDEVDISFGAFGGLGLEIPLGPVKIPLGLRLEWISAEAFLMTVGGSFGLKF